MTMYFNPRFHYGKRREQFKEYCIRDVTSIHASTMGSDDFYVHHLESVENFNPRFHYGKRPEFGVKKVTDLQTSIHASTMGSDL